MIVTLGNNSAELSQESTARKITLTHTVNENDGSFENADIIVKSKLDVVEGESKKSIQSTAAMTFGEKKQLVHGWQRSTVNDNPPVETSLKVKSKVTKM